MRKFLLPVFLIVFMFALSVKFGQIDIAKAATQDNATGTYTDTFSNSLGIGTTTQTYVTSGSVKLDLGTTSFYAPFDTDLNATSSLGSGTANNAGLTFPSLTSSGYVNSALNAQTDKTLRFESTGNLASNKAQIDMWLKTNPDFYNNGDQSGTFNQPFGVYYDSASEFIFIADNTNHRIVKTKIDGTGWTSYGTNGTGVGNFYYPMGVSYDPASEFIFVADYYNNRIVKTKIDGTGWTSYGTYGTGVGNFKNPTGVSYDPASEFIFVADYNNHRIVKTKIDGTGWTSYGTNGTGVGNFKNPYGVSYDPASEFIFVADTSNHRIVKTKIDGTGWQAYGSNGVGVGNLNTPFGISYDPSTEFIFVADQYNHRVIKTKINGDGWETYGSAGLVSDSFSYPTGVFYDSNSEYLYLGGFSMNNIVKTKMDGAGWRMYGYSGSGTGNFSNPTGTYFDSSSGYIFVADTSNHRIVKTKMDGTGWMVYGSYGTGVGNFNYPYGVSYDTTSGYIFVIDKTNNRIVRTKIDGTGWSSYGSNGIGVGNFKNPAGLFYDSVTEYIYVADTSNNRIVKTKIDGSDWATYGSGGAGVGNFSSPYSIFYDSTSGYLFIGDFGNHRVVKTMIDGTGWSSYGSNGSGVGNFYYPRGVSYDPSSEFIFVVDYGNSRIVKTKIDGTGWVSISNPVETILETQGDDMKVEFSPQENLLRFYPRKSDQGHVMTSAFLDWEPNEWHALSLSYDQTLGTADLYIDNVLNVSHTFSTSWTPPSFGQYFYVGSDKDGTYSSAWKGPLDELTITQDTDLYGSSGSFVTNEITPSTNGTLSWNEISISQTLNSGTVTYDVLDGDTADTGSAIVGFSSLSVDGNGKISLASLPYSTYDSIKIRANFTPSGDRSASPTVDSLSVSWNVDSTGPEKVRLYSPSQNEYTKENLPTFSWYETTDSQSSVSHYYLYIDGNQIAKDITGPISNSIISYTLVEGDLPPSSYEGLNSKNGLYEGNHNWYVLAIDSVGNTSSTIDKEERTLRVDRTNPTGTISINNNDLSTKSKSLNLHIEGTDPMPSPNTYNLPADFPSGISEYRVSTNKDFTGSSWNTLVSTTSSKDVSKDVTIDVSNYLPNLKSGETITIYLELKDQAGNETEASSISDTIVYQPTASSVVANTVTSTISNVANTVKEKVENVFKPKEEEKIEEKSIPDSTQSTNYQLPTTQSPLSFWQRLIKFIKELFRR